LGDRRHCEFTTDGGFTSWFDTTAGHQGRINRNLVLLVV